MGIHVVLWILLAALHGAMSVCVPGRSGPKEVPRPSSAAGFPSAARRARLSFPTSAEFLRTAPAASSSSPDLHMTLYSTKAASNITAGESPAGRATAELKKDFVLYHDERPHWGSSIGGFFSSPYRRAEFCNGARTLHPSTSSVDGVSSDNQRIRTRRPGAKTSHGYGKSRGPPQMLTDRSGGDSLAYLHTPGYAAVSARDWAGSLRS